MAARSLLLARHCSRPVARARGALLVGLALLGLGGQVLLAPAVAQDAESDNAARHAMEALTWLPTGYGAVSDESAGVTLVSSLESSVDVGAMERLADRTLSAFHELVGPPPDELPDIVLGQLHTFPDYARAADEYGARIFGTIDMDLARQGLLVPKHLVAWWVENIDSRPGYDVHDELVHRLAQLLVVRRYPRLGGKGGDFWRLGVAYHVEDAVLDRVLCAPAGLDLDQPLEEALEQAREAEDKNQVKALTKKLEVARTESRSRSLRKLFDQRKRDKLTLSDLSWGTSDDDMRFVSDARGCVGRLAGERGTPLAALLAGLDSELAQRPKLTTEALAALLHEHVGNNALEFLSGASRVRNKR